ncbi:tRNA pseudouridine(13) synthase TruD [Helicobacter brantae]|uniref:tRNA pseudouridine synthase D n=1 Tax=Helicobacter brantae TaxID=375927 RepID=A0A3D8J164_9HELI|nr:tRNA pseudouridine(13) synthase TruD [Helicobacter brantae]RDU70915.1 tRNA pseudouridine(13) synthase TruD [Helicobacter brantae]
MLRLSPYSHSPIHFHFTQTPRDFVVQEVPLYEPSGEGEHLYIVVRKKSLSTPELIKILSSTLGVSSKEIGYAGLKDKNALTTQALTLPKRFEHALSQSQSTLEQKNIKILSTTPHANKLRVGHLKGNKFFIRIKKVQKSDLEKIKSVLQKISDFGMPNYFGFQRFGKFGDNYLEGKAIIEGKKKIRDKKLSTFLISSYQSHLFNLWLSQRVQTSLLIQEFSPKELAKALELQSLPPIQSTHSLLSQPHPFKLLEGELMHHYPYGKLFALSDIKEEAQRFFAKDIVPCGVLSGKKTTLPLLDALSYQEEFLDHSIKEIGSHRFAWVFPQELDYRYIEEKAQLELNFFLPKGSYATILLETLANREIQGGDDV